MTEQSPENRRPVTGPGVWSSTYRYGTSAPPRPFPPNFLGRTALAYKSQGRSVVKLCSQAALSYQRELLLKGQAPAPGRRRGTKEKRKKSIIKPRALASGPLHTPLTLLSSYITWPPLTLGLQVWPQVSTSLEPIDIILPPRRQSLRLHLGTPRASFFDSPTPSPRPYDPLPTRPVHIARHRPPSAVTSPALLQEYPAPNKPKNTKKKKTSPKKPLRHDVRFARPHPFRP